MREDIKEKSDATTHAPCHIVGLGATELKRRYM